MRIAFITPGFSAAADDWCIPLLQDLAVQLRREHDLHVYTTCYPHATARYSVKGVPVQSFGTGTPGRLPWVLRQLRATRAVLRDHDQEPYDVVHGFWADGGGVVAAQVKRRRQTRSVVTVMAGELSYEPASGYGKSRRPLAGRLARYGASRADELLGLSDAHVRQIVGHNPTLFPRRSICGVDETRFCAEGPALELDGEIPVLCVASLVDVKGLKQLVLAAADASAKVRGLHLHVVGQGKNADNLKMLARETAAPVTFHGAVDHGYLGRYYRGARFCVLNSYFESHGMVVAEAAACDRLTIGADVGCMADYCPEEFLCPPGDTEALVDVLVSAARADRLPRPLSRPPTVHRMAQHLVKIYTAMLPLQGRSQK
ncbi:MAG: glycosyltransferase family 4 protein [Gammaproteobacteria bacterium]|nr:glycosyltransferase family 4 protein [Gammaproteobacteria bacterium]MDH5239643.1 glycosyltransferase family 4 protein [Gammaproteobacteria bacterium]